MSDPNSANVVVISAEAYARLKSTAASISDETAAVHTVIGGVISHIRDILATSATTAQTPQDVTADVNAALDQLDADKGQLADLATSGQSIVFPAGSDTTNGGQGADTLNAGSGNDTLTNVSLNDTVLGGQGNDTLVLGSGNDTILGGQSGDTLTSALGNDTIVTGDGNDVVTVSGAGAADLGNVDGASGSIAQTDPSAPSSQDGGDASSAVDPSASGAQPQDGSVQQPQ